MSSAITDSEGCLSESQERCIAAASGTPLDLGMYAASPHTVERRRSGSIGRGLRRLKQNGPRASDMGRAAMPNNAEENDRPLGQIDNDLDLLSEIPLDPSSPRSTYRRSGTNTMRNSFNSAGRTSNQLSYQRVSFKRLTANSCNSCADDNWQESVNVVLGREGCTNGQISMDKEGSTTSESWWASEHTGTSHSSNSTVVVGAASILRNLEANRGLADSGYFVEDFMLSELPHSYSKKTGIGELKGSNSTMLWKGSLQGAGTASTSSRSSAEVRRIDPELGNHAVTFEEMCDGLRFQQLTFHQLQQHWANLKPKAQDASSTSGSCVMQFSSQQQTAGKRSNSKEDEDWRSHAGPQEDMANERFAPGDLTAISESAGSKINTLDSNKLEAYMNACSKQCTIMSDLDLMAGAAADEGSSRINTLNSLSIEAYLSASSHTPTNSDIDGLTEKVTSSGDTGLDALAAMEDFVTASSSPSRSVTQTSGLDVLFQNSLGEGGTNRHWTADLESWEALPLKPGPDACGGSKHRELNGSRKNQDGETSDITTRQGMMKWPSDAIHQDASPKRPVAPASAAPERTCPRPVKAFTTSA